MYVQDASAKLIRTVTDKFVSHIDSRTQNVTNTLIAESDKNEELKSEVKRQIAIIQNMKNDLMRIRNGI